LVAGENVTSSSTGNMTSFSMMSSPAAMTTTDPLIGNVDYGNYDNNNNNSNSNNIHFFQ